MCQLGVPAEQLQRQVDAIREVLGNSKAIEKYVYTNHTMTQLQRFVRLHVGPNQPPIRTNPKRRAANRVVSTTASQPASQPSLKLGTIMLATRH